MNKVLGVLAGLIGVALIAFGFYAIAATTAVTDMTALMPKGVAGLNEARAIYAGSFWAMGGIILYALFAPQVRRPLLMAIGIIFGGFVVARRSEEHTSELQSLMRISYAVFCLKKKKLHT